MLWNSIWPSHSFFEIKDGLPLSQINPAAPVNSKIDLVRLAASLATEHWQALLLESRKGGDSS